MTDTAHPSAAEVVELPRINKFRINPIGGDNIQVEGNEWFCHAHEVEAFRRVAKANIAALAASQPPAGAAEVDHKAIKAALLDYFRDSRYPEVSANGAYTAIETYLRIPSRTPSEAQQGQEGGEV